MKDHDRREIELYCKSKHTQAQGCNNIDIDGTITEFARLNFDGVNVLPFFADNTKDRWVTQEKITDSHFWIFLGI